MQHDRPKAPQLKLLRELAQETGQSFAYPATKGEASREIKRLLAVKRGRRGTARTDAADRHRETKATRAAVQAGLGGATAVRPHETTGYGSTATWV